MDTALLVWGFLFSAFGLGYFIYGKQQKAVVPLCCGIGLMIFPYFVSSVIWMIVIGVVLSALPWCLRI